MTVATIPQQTVPRTGPKAKLITGEELLAMGNIGPCELIDGRIVRMNPIGRSHAYVAANLSMALNQFVRHRKLGEVLVGEIGIFIQRKPDRIRAADVVFVSKERLAQTTASGYLNTAPELVVEIISPTDRWQTVRDKLEEYFAIGVHRVWIVEPDNRDVLVYSTSTEMRKFGEGDMLTGEGVLDGFTLPVAELFEE
jgi:Uma2 family endonuclease